MMIMIKIIQSFHAVIEILVTLILLPASNLVIHSYLSFSVIVVIQPSSSIIQIVVLSLDLEHSSAGELHQRNEQNNIICDGKEGSIIILQIFGVELEDELISIRP